MVTLVMKTRTTILTGLLLCACLAFAGPATEAHGPSQAAADVLREAAGADAAFLPAGVVKDSAEGDLASLLLFPTDELAVVSLKGSQIRAALERSVSLYPSPNTGFLQLSGITATFSRSAAPERRLLSVTIGGGKLDDAKSYTVAMPGSLARGGLGYFKVWDKSRVTKTFGSTTLEAFLKGKKGNEPTPRWIPQ